MTHADMQNLQVKSKYKKVGHSFGLLKSVGKQYCHKCGLIALNNEISRWAVGKGCNYHEHTAWITTLNRLTKMRN